MKWKRCVELRVSAVCGMLAPIVARAFGASLYSWAQGRGIGFDKLVSFGNMCDIDESDVFGYLATDEDTKTIVTYMEGVKDGRKFLRIAKKVCAIKPIVIMKIGRSSRGSKAAKSHTGALTGSNAIYEGAFKQSRVIKANSTMEIFDFAKAFSTQPLPKGKKVPIVTNTGGPGVALLLSLKLPREPERK